MHRLVLHNQSIVDALEPCLAPGQVGLMTGWGVFSTLRVRDGVLFAWDRHVARMRRDAQLLHIPFPDNPDELHADLLRLIEANNALNSTLRVNIVRNNGGAFHAPTPRTYDVIAFTADLADWGESVRLGVVPQARHAQNVYAGTKVTSWAFNLTWYEKAHEDGYDEVLLLDETGYVSECTSANIFAVFGYEVRTPPLTCGCLPGITRELLLTEIDTSPYVVREQAVTLADLEIADSVFITSTTRDLLPVASIEGLAIRQSRTVIDPLLTRFRDYQAAWVKAHSPATAPALG